MHIIQVKATIGPLFYLVGHYKLLNKKMNVQSVRVSREGNTYKKAVKKVMSQGYRVRGVPDNKQYKNYFSFRQRQPKEYKKGSFRTVKVGDMLFVLGRLKSK